MGESRRHTAEDQTREKQLKERQSEATSKETLDDLANSEKDSGGGPVEKGNEVPAPDGQLGEGRHSDPAGPV